MRRVSKTPKTAARVVTGAVVALLALVPLGAVAITWDAPREAAQTQNALPHDKQAVAQGKAIYEASCAVCHDDRGRGKGPAAVALNPRPRPFSDKPIASQADGAFFWKITTGRPPMPAWGGTLSEAQRWQVIHYMHTLMGPLHAQHGG